MFAPTGQICGGFIKNFLPCPIIIQFDKKTFIREVRSFKKMNFTIILLFQLIKTPIILKIIVYPFYDTIQIKLFNNFH